MCVDDDSDSMSEGPASSARESQARAQLGLGLSTSPPGCLGEEEYCSQEKACAKRESMLGALGVVVVWLSGEEGGTGERRQVRPAAYPT